MNHRERRRREHSQRLVAQKLRDAVQEPSVILEKSQEAQNKSNTSTPTEKRNQLYTVVGAILGVCTVVGCLVGLLILVPRPLVSPPQGEIENRDVSFVAFDISNSGILPLRDVCAYIRLGWFGVRNPSTPSGEPHIWVTTNSPALFDGNTFTNNSWLHHNLQVDERFTISLADAIEAFRQRGPIDDADIAIAVTYKTWPIPIRRTKLFRFKTSIIGSKVRMRSWPLEAPMPESR